MKERKLKTAVATWLTAGLFVVQPPTRNAISFPAEKIRRKEQTACSDSRKVFIAAATSLQKADTL